jgi:uncharacterized membrane protein
MDGSTTPLWALTLAYWLHMLSTVMWIGGLTALVLLVIPAAQRTLDEPAYLALLQNLQRRLDPLGWFCLVMLSATGMFQMSASPAYGGFLAIDTVWATAILLKHIAFLAMIGVSAYFTWGLLPTLRRLALQMSQGKGSPAEQERLQRRNTLLLRLNLGLSVVILALTALARAA